MKAKIFLFALAFSGMALTASAQTATKTITQTQRAQQVRITKGVKKGDLTIREAKQLRVQQAQIQRKKMIVRSDGVVTPRERIQVRRMQKQAARDITRQRNDRQSRN